MSRRIVMAARRSVISVLVWPTVGLALALLAGLLAAAPPALAATLQPTSLHVIDWQNGGSRSLDVVPLGQEQHVTLWVQSGRQLPEAPLRELLTEIDDQIYPTLASALGDERAGSVEPGLQVQVVLYEFGVESVSGYFNPADLGAGGLLPPHVEEGGVAVPANGGRFVYLDLASVRVDPERAPAIAAHEIAHLLLFLQDQRSLDNLGGSVEDRWVQEGVATYAELLTGYPEHLEEGLRSLEVDPEDNLLDWGGFRRDYGSAGSFIAYLVQRQPSGFLRTLALTPTDGRLGVDDALEAAGSPHDFTELFGDWVLSLVMDSMQPPLPPYFFEQLDVSVPPVSLETQLPLVDIAQVPAFGGLFLQLPESASRLSLVMDASDGATFTAAAIIRPTAEGQPRFTPIAFRQPGNAAAMLLPPSASPPILVIWADGEDAGGYPVRVSVATEEEADAQFLDLDFNHTFYAYIAELAERGLIDGKENPAGSGLRYFYPDAPVLRAQFAKILVGAFGLHTDQVEERERGFVDVISGESYPGDYVYEAREAGVVLGFEDGLFRPWANLTRLQLVRMIIRASAAVGNPLNPYTGKEAVFADLPPSDPDYHDVMTAYEAGILDGGFGPDGRRYFWPYKQATRGHVSKMTVKLLQNNQGANGFSRG